MLKTPLFAIWVCSACAAFAQDADLTIFVDGPLLEHGGVVEVTAVPLLNGSPTAQTITLSDRYARVQLPFLEGARYTYRFRPVPDVTERDGMDQFLTEILSFAGRNVDGPDGQIDADWRSVRVFPFQEYAGIDEATRVSAAWGETQAFMDPPPANHWGARALPFAFDTFGNRRTVGLICHESGAVTVCKPDPADALLLEALWWREIAEGRLERLRHDALQECYDSGGLFRRPDRCEGDAGRGWPNYRPAD